jgi:hypothetical protein
MTTNAAEFIDTHCTGLSREVKICALSALLDQQKQDFIDELSIYLAMRHRGLTSADAKMVNHMLKLS